MNVLFVGQQEQMIAKFEHNFHFLENWFVYHLHIFDTIDFRFDCFFI